ncbi:ras association domain-containing protein 8 [Oryzias latipes]|uniref:Ras association domain family member 7 n=1 Tax=Oryzias latipes TaxID=8090 RepID=A0A3B3H6V7_ORYLA|nr:ras association domain-containing protein 8 [Oryzias latipes]XP_011491020.1 ras association domain-containing protein 8 [Oryzias latipes]XP_011491021.1 ras association domain-containing protein 8 [Oryzias latipes]XP_020555540.1 ras association domain-containing protein 8 [Oryzias latipes]XP_020555541.1 ras association domain-containing protein 8 [Oryzias latipes]
MELKVWVDGAVRVVCGLSEETSCQDVVIALAQAIGQTGRYVLIQRLRDTERQLLATERPLESLAKLGQHGGEVQFFLRRTGPSSSDGCSSKNDKTAQNSLPKHPEPEPLKRNQPKKALTFNLGPSTSPKSTPKQVSRSPRDSPEQRSSPSPHPESPHGTKPGHSPSVRPSKNEVFKKVLQQQERLRAIEAQLESVEKDSHTWKCSYPSPCPSPVSNGQLTEEIHFLEQEMQKKQDELAFEKYWEDELQSEVEKDQEMRHKLGQLQAQLDDCGRQLHELSVRSAQLEKEVQQESQAKDKSHGPQDTVEAVKAKLRSQEKRVIELGEQLSETEKALGKAESVLQAKNEEVEELNKELRQCNLQQFIQQTGVLPSQARSDLQEQLELTHLLQDSLQDGQSVTPGESPPRPTAKQFLGHPRNLQNPLVSSLNPEVLTSRESSWR